MNRKEARIVLGVSDETEQKAIQSAFKNKVKSLDGSESNEVLLKLIEARDILLESNTHLQAVKQDSNKNALEIILQNQLGLQKDQMGRDAYKDFEKRINSIRRFSYRRSRLKRLQEHVSLVGVISLAFGIFAEKIVPNLLYLQSDKTDFGVDQLALVLAACSSIVYIQLRQLAKELENRIDDIKQQFTSRINISKILQNIFDEEQCMEVEEFEQELRSQVYYRLPDYFVGKGTNLKVNPRFDYDAADDITSEFVEYLCNSGFIEIRRDQVRLL